MLTTSWDYLIVTAANESQAEAYRAQLNLRERLGLIQGFKNILVVPDKEGKRIGSGGSTILCLLEIINRELRQPTERQDPQARQATFQDQRILILHAGGDARRLPPYSPCGKIFVPLPTETDTVLTETIFDRQLPIYAALPAPWKKRGQIVITSGDVLLDFDPVSVQFGGQGITGLASYAEPELASHHGVYCTDTEGAVTRFLQKPSVEEQEEFGAIDRYGRTLLDIGIFNLSSDAAMRLLNVFEPRLEGKELVWSGPLAEATMEQSLDFYREIACALGTETRREEYLNRARQAGSTFSDENLAKLLGALAGSKSDPAVPLQVEKLASCQFLHFGTPRQILESGRKLLDREAGIRRRHQLLWMNSRTAFQAVGRSAKDPMELIQATGPAWIEGCHVAAELHLEGDNVLTGVRILPQEDSQSSVTAESAVPRSTRPTVARATSPVTFRQGQCLDIVPASGGGYYVRPYHIDDSFKKLADTATYCGIPLEEWMKTVGGTPKELWDNSEEQTLWTAKLFKKVQNPTDFELWVFDPGPAPLEKKEKWLQDARYSCAEIAESTDQERYHQIRTKHRGDEVARSLRNVFRKDSGFSAGELAYLLEQLPAELAEEKITEVLESVQADLDDLPGHRLERLEASRILHTVATALERSPGVRKLSFRTSSPELAADWSNPEETTPDVLKSAAFTILRQTITNTGTRETRPARPTRSTRPTSSLRSDEIVWGRAPARLDLGGGWTDTPPYALENGGCVLNVAVDLNGQPPIHAYARLCKDPVLKITSIDHGVTVTIETWEELLDYDLDGFGLAKAALAQAFARGTRVTRSARLTRSNPISSQRVNELTSEAGETSKTGELPEFLGEFGGGIELTTLAAIPSGSGLGTSSIMGAVLLSALDRLTASSQRVNESTSKADPVSTTGSLSRRTLCNRVLQLEQELTSGGGWQDQIGGVVEGLKIIRSEAGLIPDPRIHFVPHDLIDPIKNGGQTLLYYTGIRRLAKNILKEIVGRYLDRERETLDILRRLHAVPERVADALARRDLRAFGELIGEVWHLNKSLDPGSTTPEIEDLLTRTDDKIYGAKLLGAGGGGFLFLVCRSSEDAEFLKKDLESAPLNERARFFDYSISNDGLQVTVC